MIKSSTRPLSNMQEELLRLYSTGVSDETLVEVKELLAKYFFEKAVAKADAVAKEKGYNEETIQSWLNED